MGINDFIKIGYKIKSLRKSLGISQKEMAKRLDIPYSTYSNYENNNREPNSDIIKKICKILNVSTFELIADEKLSENQELFNYWKNTLKETEDEKKERRKLNFVNIEKDLKPLLNKFKYDFEYDHSKNSDFKAPVRLIRTDNELNNLPSIITFDSYEDFMRKSVDMLNDINLYKKKALLYFLATSNDNIKLINTADNKLETKEEN